MKKYTIEIEDKEGNTLGFIVIENGEPKEGIDFELIDSDESQLIVRHDPIEDGFGFNTNELNMD